MAKKICNDCARYSCGLVAEETGIKCDCRCHETLKELFKPLLEEMRKD